MPTIIGSAVCGALVFAIWPEMWKSYGIMGGWLAAFILISISWYMNHWMGIIYNPEGKIWIDQGWAVGAAGVTWAYFRFYPDVVLWKCWPTLVLCLIGGAIGGKLACLTKKKHCAFTAPQEAADSE